MLNGRRAGVLVLLCGVFAAMAVTLAALNLARPAAPTRMDSAEAFVDSVGVVIHPDFLDTPYVEQGRIFAALRWLGIRHVRATVQSSTAPHLRDMNRRHDDFLLRLARHGILTNLMVPFPGGRTGTLEETLAVVRGRLRRATSALEGPNEPDMAGGAGWPERTRTYQRELYERVKADPALRAMPVLAPGLGIRWEPNDVRGIGRWADYTNVHAYPNARPPSDFHVTEALFRQQSVTNWKPLVVTETGYHNAMRSTAGHLPVSERAAGIYAPRLLLDHFQRGIKRTYLYELIDEFPDADLDNPEAHFGQLRRDFSPKPAATNIRNLLSLASMGSAAQADARAPSADVTVDGAAGRARRLTLRLEDGSLLVFLWQDVSVWDRRGRRDLHPDAVSGEMNVPPGYSSADYHLVSRGVRRIDRVALRGELTVEVPGDDILAMRLHPAG